MTASTRADLYAETCDFLKESRVAVGSAGPLAARIASQEVSAAEFALSLHPYNFASRVHELAMVAQADADPTVIDATLAGFTYAYAMPDVAKITWVSKGPSERYRLTSGTQWTQMEGRILSHFQPLYMNGVRKEYALTAKIGYWPRLFCTGVASLLADRLMGPVTNSRTWAADMTERSRAYLEEAATWDANQAPAPIRRPGRWLRSRHGWRGPGEEIR